jgi:hypothetical protein
LYLIGQEHADVTPDRGIYVYEIAGRSARFRQFVSAHADNGFHSEFEGITVWPEAASLGAPRARGDVHWLLLNNEVGSRDKVSMRHFRVTPGLP